jgi:hypothetical protein
MFSVSGGNLLWWQGYNAWIPFEQWQTLTMLFCYCVTATYFCLAGFVDFITIIPKCFNCIGQYQIA